VTDITSMYSMLAVMGPRSRELLQRVSTARFDSASFPFGSSQEIDVGYATVRATRLTYDRESWDGSSMCRSNSPSASMSNCTWRVAIWADGRGLLRDRFAAAGKGLPCLGTRADPRRQPVRSRPGVRGTAGQSPTFAASGRFRP
jgi:hypothetical protein